MDMFLLFVGIGRYVVVVVYNNNNNNNNNNDVGLVKNNDHRHPKERGNVGNEYDRGIAV
jgi:hypothetical protein